MTDVITCQHFLACRKVTICTIVHRRVVEDYLLVAVIVKSENPRACGGHRNSSCMVHREMIFDFAFPLSAPE
jgi:hypothetical protein